MTVYSHVNRTMNAAEWGMLVILAILWGGSFFFVALAVRELPTFMIVATRVVLAAAIMIAGLRMMSVALPSTRRAWLAFLGMGLLNNVIPFSLIIWGQIHVASGIAAIITASTPLFTVVLAHFVSDDEKMTPGRVAGILVGLAGVIVMIGGSALEALKADLLGELAILAGAVSYACSSLFGRRFSRFGLSAPVTATGTLAASSLLLVPLALVIDQPWTLAAPSLTAMLCVLALALLSTVVAYMLYFRLLATAGATNLMLVNFLVPVTAVLLGVTVLGEHLEAKHFAGIALIAVGLFAIDGRLWPWLRARLR